MFNWIVSDAYQYLEPGNSVQTNEYCWIEFVVLCSNSFNSLTVCLNKNISITLQYLETFERSNKRSVQ